MRVGIGGPAGAWSLLVALAVGGLPGCGAGRPSDSSPARVPVTVAQDARPRIVTLGDSLTAGLGLKREEAYPAILQRELDAKGYSYEVLNAGVSGDTSAGALRRLDLALEGNVRVLIVALGANDALRGLPVQEMKRNLAAIVQRAQARGVSVLLAGMEAPPNLGDGYTRQYRDAFGDLARENRVEFVPFLLAGVAGIPELNQADGIHPTAVGARRIVENLWPALERLLKHPRPS